MILRQHLLIVQYDLWGIYFTVTWKIMDTSTLTKFPNLSQPWFPEKKLDRLDTIKCQDFRIYLHSLHDKIKIRSSNFETEYPFPSLTYPSERAKSHSSLGKFFGNCWNLFHKTSDIHNKGWTGRDYQKVL